MVHGCAPERAQHLPSTRRHSVGSARMHAQLELGCREHLHSLWRVRLSSSFRILRRHPVATTASVANVSCQLQVFRLQRARHGRLGRSEQHGPALAAAAAVYSHGASYPQRCLSDRPCPVDHLRKRRQSTGELEGAPERTSIPWADGWRAAHRLVSSRVGALAQVEEARNASADEKQSTDAVGKRAARRELDRSG
eukprot:3737584-Prymnesium_polylepis.2